MSLVNNKLGYIYVIYNPSFDKFQVKIGSTKNYENRYQTYRTYYKDPSTFTKVYQIGKSSEYNCYQIDEYLKKISNEYNISRYKVKNGGTEHYTLKDTSDLENFFKEYNIQVSDITSNIDVNSFTSITKRKLDNFEANEKINYWKSVDMGKIFEKKVKKLRKNIKNIWPVQKDWRDDIIQEFKINDRCRINLACGLGKSLLYYWTFKEMKCKNCIIFVSSLYLLGQIFLEWRQQSIDEEYPLEFYYNSTELQITNVNLTNEQKKNINRIKKNCSHISNFELNRNKTQVILSTYHSSKNFSEYKNLKEIKWDISFNDEAHRLAFAKSGITIEEEKSDDGLSQHEIIHRFQYPLSNENIKIKKRLSGTASEKYYNDCDDKENDISHVVSMDNEELFGRCVVKVNFGDAINMKRLVDYKFITPKQFIEDYENEINYLILNDPIISELYRNARTKSEKNELIYNKEFIKRRKYFVFAIMLLKSIVQYNMKHILTFHSSVNNAKIFSEILKFTIKYLITINEIESTKFTNYFFDNVNGYMKMRERNTKIEQYKDSNIGVLCSAQLFNEGVNLPFTDGISFIDNRSGQISVTQCFGRPLRLYPKKELAYIFVPCFISDEKSLNEVKDFRKLRMIIQNLSIQDNAFFKKYNSGKSRKKLTPEQEKLLKEEEKAIEKIEEKNKQDAMIEEFSRDKSIGEKSFIECREFAISRKFTRVADGKEYFSKSRELPEEFPRNPEKLYKNYGWKEWAHFLGLNDEGLKFEYEKLKIYVQELNLNTNAEYEELVESDDKLIQDPDNKYKKFWKDWYNFLGIDTDNYIQNLEDWKKRCKILGIKSWNDYKKMCEKNKELPTMPNKFYRNFTNIRNELGITSRRRR